MTSGFEMLMRLGLACILGGLIGIEREKNRHPAGLRTHILVCIGSTLVMLCNIYIFELYKHQTNMDPARLGAQVISGIGFLGAGTIIKEGVSVKGLTTAASLWAVACIGIAIGVGFYSGAILATLFVLIALIIFSKFEYLFYRTKNYKVSIRISNLNEDISFADIDELLKKMTIEVTSINSENSSNGKTQVIVTALNHKGMSLIGIADELRKKTGIEAIEVCE